MSIFLDAGAHAAVSALVALTAICGLLTLASPAQAAFPGANGRIAFDSDRDGNTEVYTMNADGTGVTQLTNTVTFADEPNWSADGMSIAFNLGSQVYRMNADGSGQTALTTSPADEDPCWAPDSTRLVFASSRDGNFEIYTMNADGSAPTRITNNPAFDTEPMWSPDGTRIAFASNRDGNFEIYTMNTDGTGLTRVTNDPTSDREPTWSPDATKIAFDSQRTGGDEIFTMNADGTGVAQVTSGGGNRDPAWSPDGAKIAFLTGRDGNAEIYTMNTDGSAQTRITNNAAFDSRPDWQPVPAGDLTLTKSDSPDPVLVGDVLTYTVTVENNGASFASGVTVTDVLPKRVRFLSATASKGGCSRRQKNVTCALGDLVGGDSATLTIVVRPTRSGTITNSASVTAISPMDPNPLNNTATADTRVLR